MIGIDGVETFYAYGNPKPGKASVFKRPQKVGENWSAPTTKFEYFCGLIPMVKKPTSNGSKTDFKMVISKQH
jgi:hypothetical protein